MPVQASLPTARWRIAGTPTSIDHGLGEALQRHLREAGRIVDGPSGTVEPVASWLNNAETHIIVLVEPPESALARWIAGGASPFDPYNALAQWHAAAQELLRLAYRGSPRCLFVDVAEASEDLSALARALAEWHPDLRGAKLNAAAIPFIDVVVEAIAQRSAWRDAPAQRAYEELLAACAPLSGSGGQPASRRRREDDASAAVNHYRALLAARQTAEATARSASSERDELRVELERSRAATAGAIAARELLEPQLADARLEAERRQDLLQDLQIEVESLYLRQRETEHRLQTAAEESAASAGHLAAAEAKASRSASEVEAQTRLLDEQRIAFERSEADRLKLVEQAAAADRAAIEFEAERSRLELRAQRAEAAVQSAEQALKARTEGLARKESELSHALTEKSRVAAELERAVAKLAAVNADRASAQDLLGAARSELEETRARLDAMNADRMALKDHLEAARSELEESRAKHEDAAAISARLLEQTAEALTLESEAARRDRAALSQQLAHVLAGAERSREKGAAREQQLSEELAALRSAMGALRHESELASRGLALVREQIEAREREDRRAGKPPEVEVAEVSVGEARLQAPHRELGIVVRGVRLMDFVIDALELRLVEHRGRPGLVVTECERGRPPLKAWAENSREGDRGQMLLVPADTPARRTLSLLGTQDWLLLRGLVAGIERALAHAGGDGLWPWHQVARRLLAELDSLPSRLRYDDLIVDVEPSASESDQRPREPATFRVQFGRALFGGRFLDKLTLRWKPGATSAPVEMVGPSAPETAPALAAWPTEGVGWAPSWNLPLARGRLSGEQVQAWRNLPVADRDLLLALLDAMPAAAGLLADEGRLPPGTTRDAMIAELLHWQELAAGAVTAPANPILRAARRWQERRRPSRDEGEAA